MNIREAVVSSRENLRPFQTDAIPPSRKGRAFLRRSNDTEYSRIEYSLFAGWAMREPRSRAYIQPGSGRKREWADRGAVLKKALR
jgi:hypothetical protein